MDKLPRLPSFWYYMLDDDHNVVRMEAPTPDDVAKAWDKDRRRVGFDTVEGYDISTVFLPIDHRISGEGEPVVFETMVFGGGDNTTDLYTRRYMSWDAAKEGHRDTVHMVENLEEDQWR